MYRLPEISGGNCPIYICEGEKAANAAAEMLLASTTSAHGSQSPGKTDWSPVSGRDVVILPDNDEAGRKYARCVADLTHKAGAKGVKIVELPALPDKGDIVEWIEARPGKQPEENRSELEELVRQTEPWRPPSGDGRGLDPIDAAKTGNAYAQTDLGNAERLVALHGHEIRWDTALKAWRVLDGRRWAVDSSLKLNTMAAETVRSIRREAARRLDCSIRAVDHWARMGILKKVKISGRKRAVGFRETDITALIENNQ
jgi:putative DNA primase/helicase